MKSTRGNITKEVKYYNGLKWNRALTKKMQEFEKETKKKAVYRGKVTGQFEYWLYWQKSTKPKAKPKPTKKQAPAKKKGTKKYTPLLEKERSIIYEQEFQEEIKKPEVRLTGTDGNAFMIMGKVAGAMRRAGYSQADIDKFHAEATSGDYDHLLQTCCKYVDVS